MWLNRTRLGVVLISPALVALPIFQAVSVQAQTTVSAPPTGAAVVSSAHFQNVFVFAPATPNETWDQHLRTFLEKDKASTPGHLAVDNDLETNATSEAINAFVAALTQSSYFSFAQQYGINSVAFDGGIDASPLCLTTAMVSGATPDYGDLTNFVSCETTNGAKDPQLNLIFSPDISPPKQLAGAAALCAPGSDGTGKANGFHSTVTTTNDVAWGAWAGLILFGPLGLIGGAAVGGTTSEQNFTVLPLNPMCGTTFDQLASAISHEMIETVTDPAGLGWHAGALTDTSSYNTGEVGDVCNGGPANPSGTNPIATMPFLTVHVARYWSKIRPAACRTMIHYLHRSRLVARSLRR